MIAGIGENLFIFYIMLELAQQGQTVVQEKKNAEPARVLDSTRVCGLGPWTTFTLSRGILIHGEILRLNCMYSCVWVFHNRSVMSANNKLRWRFRLQIVDRRYHLGYQGSCRLQPRAMRFCSSPACALQLLSNVKVLWHHKHHSLSAAICISCMCMTIPCTVA